MATITKAQLAVRVLKRLTVLALGQTAAAADSLFVEDYVDTAYAKLRKFELMPFAVSAIPEWAQDGLERYVAAEVAPHFGKQMNKEAEQTAAEKELRRQAAAYKHNLRTVAEYF